MFIKNFIKVFGAVIGSAIVLPLSFGYSGALMLANTFKGFGSSGVNQWVSSTPNKISGIDSIRKKKEREYGRSENIF